MDEFENESLPLSKTRKKKLAKEIEQLADQLTAMPENRLKQLALGEELSHEVGLARATKGRSSQRRQVKHLAGLLRKQNDQVERLLAQMQELDQVVRSEKKAFQGVEKLRDRLCDPASFDAAFEELLGHYPGVDQKTIARLARSVHQYADKRAYREIFKRLRDCQESDPG